MRALLIVAVALAGLVGPARRDPPREGCTGRIVIETERARACVFPT